MENKKKIRLTPKLEPMDKVRNIPRAKVGIWIRFIAVAARQPAFVE